MPFVKAVALGFCIAAPVGAIGMLCIQRSLSRGFRSGFATGIGAACADAFYGLLGALGVAGIVTALPMLTVALKAAGGAFLVWMAWTIAREAPRAPAAVQETSRTPVTRDFLTTFALTLSNPLTIFSFIAAFAALGPLPSHVGRAWRAGMAFGGAHGDGCVRGFGGVVVVPERRDLRVANKVAARIHAGHFHFLRRGDCHVWHRSNGHGTRAARLARSQGVVSIRSSACATSSM